MKESLPSSSSLSTSTSTPAAVPISRAAGSPLLASRTAAVATARIVSAPSSRANLTWVETTSATSATFSAVIAPSASSALLMRV